MVEVTTRVEVEDLLEPDLDRQRARQNFEKQEQGKNTSETKSRVTSKESAIQGYRFSSDCLNAMQSDASRKMNRFWRTF
jgi:hypothetical protein